MSMGCQLQLLGRSSRTKEADECRRAEPPLRNPGDDGAAFLGQCKGPRCHDADEQHRHDARIATPSTRRWNMASERNNHKMYFCPLRSDVIALTSFQLGKPVRRGIRGTAFRATSERALAGNAKSSKRVEQTQPDFNAPLFYPTTGGVPWV
jgi:hypothetical protein